MHSLAQENYEVEPEVASETLRPKTALLGALAAVIFGLGSAEATAQSLAPKETIIPNVLPTMSYIRLYGADSSNPTTFEIKVQGTVTGKLYRQFSFEGQPNVSRQLNPGDLTGGNNLDPRDTTLYVTVRGVRPNLYDLGGLYQHVRFNPSNRTLENMSECAFNNVAYLNGYYRNYYLLQGRFLPHVHTSKLPGYSSYINITNPDDVSRQFMIQGSDVDNGTAPIQRDPLTGKVVAPKVKVTSTVTVPAHGSVRVPFSSAEQASRFTPEAGETQMNVVVSEVYTAGEPPYTGTAVVSHTVLDDQSLAETNLSQYCPVEGVSITPTPLGGGTYANKRSGGAGENCSDSDWEVTSTCSQVIDHPANLTTLGRVKGSADPKAGIGSGAAGNGMIYPSGDVDWWRVLLNQGTAYTVIAAPSNNSTVTGRTADKATDTSLFKSKVTIRDPSGNPVSMREWEGQQNGNGYTVFVPQQTGDYIVEVAASDGASTGSYQLQLNSIFKEDVCNPVDPQDFFRSENTCNETGADFAANDTTKGVLCVNCDNGWSSLIPASDVDWHKVYLVAGTTYMFDVDRVGSGNGSTSDPLFAGLDARRMRLLNASKTVLAEDTGKHIPGVIQPTCPVPTRISQNGKWIVFVDGKETEVDPCAEPTVQDDPARITYTATDTGYYYVEISSADGVSFGGYKIVVRR